MIERDDHGGGDDRVAVLRLAHGPVSAMDLELCQAIGEQFRALADDPARAVVVTGTGRTFSAGADLKRYLHEGAPYVERFLPALSEAFRAVFELSKPVVAAVNGHAIAGGCVLAACADVRLMAEGGGRIGVPEGRVGPPFPRIAIEVLRHAVGDVTARRLMVGALTYSPAEALAMALVDRVLPPEELLPQAVATARAMATEVPSDTFALTKAQLNRDALERTARYADEDAAVTGLWSRRAEDGWTARYLESLTQR
ncbi:enoyl-CoA hydratase/isomerase family protein [Pseudonocardia sp.]|jgi:enoyl-CoA hydratase|uniref:enoyl-CoA hydratase/isomerase family protein n=1 Tax=Pseudonocardia sp. TaxID=60912 RepID=UPI0031FBD81A